MNLNTSHSRFRGSKAGLMLVLLMLMLSTRFSLAQDLTNFSNQHPVNLAGSFEGRGTYYNAHGMADRREPYSYLFNAAATLNIYGLSIPFSATYSEADRSFRQPFNQFGISPTYKWITLHAGYRNIDYSPYTLGGHTILGAGIDLHPGKLRVGFMYGKLNRATTVDTTTQALVPYSFSRKAYAGKLGYGSERNFFELSYLQARDDSSSVARQTIPQADYVAPASNNVFGYATKISFLKKFSIETKGAASIYTRDINSPIAIGVDNKIINQFKKIGDFNGTTELYTALDASLNYRSNNYGLKVDYKRIDPEYKTMGSYFFDSDVESWTFGPNMNIIKGKVRLAGNIGFQHDNLLNQKRSTNKRVIGSANVSADITKALAVDVNYSNFSNDQMPNTVKFPDSLRIVQTTQNTTITPRYTIIKPSTIQTISLSYSLNKLKDYNRIITSGQSTGSNIDTKQYFINYSINLPKQNLGMFLNINRTHLSSEVIDNVYQGVTVGGYATKLKNKLQVNLSASFIQGITPQGKSLIINATGSLSYKMSRIQQLKTAMFYTNNNPTPGSTQTRFNEFRNELSYILNF